MILEAQICKNLPVQIVTIKNRKRKTVKVVEYIDIVYAPNYFSPIFYITIKVGNQFLIDKVIPA